MAHDAETLAFLKTKGVDTEALIARSEDRFDGECAQWVLQLETDVAPSLLRAGWFPRREGMDGLGLWEHRRKGQRLIQSLSREDDGEIWSHLSVSRYDRVLPTWEQTRDIAWLIHPFLAGIIVVAPRSEHVNIGEVMHVWTCLTRQVIPDFTAGLGTI